MIRSLACLARVLLATGPLAGAEVDSTATEDFDGIDRNDDLLFTVKYFMNRHLYLLVGIEQESRDTSGAASDGREYDIHTLQVRLQGNL
jgi:hypothetical protein